MPPYMFVVGAKIFIANQNVKYEYFECVCSGYKCHSGERNS